MLRDQFAALSSEAVSQVFKSVARRDCRAHEAGRGTSWGNTVIVLPQTNVSSPICRGVGRKFCRRVGSTASNG